MNAKRSGLVFLKKSSGITSFKALGSIKRALGHGKVGHAGTLDMFAEGLLIVAVGNATRLLSLFEGLPKSYTGTICFGQTTDTLDPEGEVIGEGPVPSYNTIIDSLRHFKGAIRQVPPVYSALNIRGVRASERARRGEDVPMQARDVTIHRIEIKEWQPPLLTIEVDCSKGTYIRSLARDMGEACGSAAYLQALTRTAIGPFSLDDAIIAEDFNPDLHVRGHSWFFQKIPSVDTIQVLSGREDFVLHGTPFSEEWISGPIRKDQIALFSHNDQFLAFLFKESGKWKYKMVESMVDSGGGS